jgi:hypothetical protein
MRDFHATIGARVCDPSNFANRATVKWNEGLGDDPTVAADVRRL